MSDWDGIGKGLGDALQIIGGRMMDREQSKREREEWRKLQLEEEERRERQALERRAKYEPPQSREREVDEGGKRYRVRDEWRVDPDRGGSWQEAGRQEVPTRTDYRRFTEGDEFVTYAVDHDTGQRREAVSRAPRYKRPPVMSTPSSSGGRRPVAAYFDDQQALIDPETREPIRVRMPDGSERAAVGPRWQGNEKPSRYARTSATKPRAPQEPDAEMSGFRFIGTTPEGHRVYEDANGRQFVDDGGR